MNIEKPFAKSAATALVMCLTLAATFRQTPAQDLPPAAELVAAHRTAVGAEALSGHTSMRSTGTFSMPDNGITGRFELSTARPLRRAMRVTLQGIGEIRAGYSDEVAWSLNPVEGPRLLTGAEAAQAADEAIFGASLRSSGISSMTTVDDTSFGGHDCFKVLVKWKSGRESFDCYSAESGLRIASVAMEASSMGAMESVTLYDDYRDFDGYLIPTRWTVTVPAMGTRQIIEIRSVEFDVVPDSAFAIPDRIKPLIAVAPESPSGAR